MITVYIIDDRYDFVNRFVLRNGTPLVPVLPVTLQQSSLGLAIELFIPTYSIEKRDSLLSRKTSHTQLTLLGACSGYPGGLVQSSSLSEPTVTVNEYTHFTDCHSNERPLFHWSQCHNQITINQPLRLNQALS